MHKISYYSNTKQKKSVNPNDTYDISVLLLGRGVGEICSQMNGDSYPCRIGLKCEIRSGYNGQCFDKKGK